MQKTSCLRNHHRCDELNEFWLRLQFVKFEGRLRPFVKLMKTVSIRLIRQILASLR